jgi:hypothetical protein
MVATTNVENTLQSTMYEFRAYGKNHFLQPPMVKFLKRKPIQMPLQMAKSILIGLALFTAAVLVTLQHVSSNRRAVLSEIAIRNPAGPRSQMNFNVHDYGHSQLFASEESAFPNCAIAWRSCNDKATDCIEVWRSAGLLQSWKTACMSPEADIAK